MANDDLEFDELSLYIVFRDSPRDGYTSEHGHQITPFRKRPMGHVKGAAPWTKRHPYSRFVSSVGRVCIQNPRFIIASVLDSI